MWILLLGLTSGLMAPSWAYPVQDVKQRSCSYAGVFLIQGNNRYSLTLAEARHVCHSLGTLLANESQLSKAYEVGLETCRYGWVESGNITILRKVSNHLCANSTTGIINFIPTEHTYDAYCYDAKADQSGKNCTFEIKYTETTDSESRTEVSTGLSMTVTPVSYSTDTTDTVVTKVTHVTEKTTATSLPDKADDTEEIQDLTTQSSTMSIEDESSDQLEKEITTIISSLDSIGSGMGEITHTTISEPAPEDSTTTTGDHDIDADNTHESPNGDEDHTVVSSGKTLMDTLPEEEEHSGNSKDWLVILLVVLAIVAIILVAALWLTRNRWRGRSQTLMITSKSSNEGNGTAASAASPQDQEREQEMVTLMNKEKIQENGNTEEFTVVTLEESPEKNQEA